MNLFGMMETSGSAMQAERIRAEVVATNMANAETTRTADGGPYQRQHVIFAANAPDPEFAGSLSQATAALNMDNMLNPLPTATANGAAMSLPGVHVAGVVADKNNVLKRYDPGHPDAGEDGFVSFPDINPITEMVDLMGATRAYGLNSSAVQAEKTMITSALDIVKAG